MPAYSEAFKAKMIKKMLPPDPVSAHRLSGRVGVTQSTLSRWLREAQDGNGMSKRKKSRKKWTTLEKLRVVVEASALSDAELGQFLRREGVHEAQLHEWREAADEALSGSRKGKKKVSREQKQIRELERDVRRKDRALAEATALLVLKKKVQEIWGDEDGDTTEGNEK